MAARTKRVNSLNWTANTHVLAAAAAVHGKNVEANS
jgi:hypothetical protein